jgi:hypothetical protein
LFRHVHAPVSRGDTSFLARYRTLAVARNAPLTPEFEQKVLAFCWAAEDHVMFGIRKGVLFEWLLYHCLAPRYQPPRGWVQENVHVVLRQPDGSQDEADGDVDVAGWAQVDQEGEFYSAKFQGNFKQLDLNDLVALYAHLGSGVAHTVVAAWGLTTTRQQLREMLASHGVSLPPEVRFFGFDDLAALKVRIPERP